ncbi:MAG: hypothetical protein HQ501_03480 [Rhodospirillales bacterium]|nr:hypothetical protein [Rhodospirillales bacterium]
MLKDENGKDTDAAVGYRKPPKYTQFKKGRSGNPAGRPKLREPESVDVSEVLNPAIKVKIEGKVHNMDAFEASVRLLARRAANGNLPAIIRFVRLCEQYGAVTPSEPPINGGVIFAPKGISPSDWVEGFAKEVPIDKT